MDLTTAVTIFLKQAVREQRIPFEVFRDPSDTTIKAMKEAEEIIKSPNAAKHYSNAQEMMDDVLK